MYAESQVASTAPRLPGKLPLTATLLVLGALAASAAPWFLELDPLTVVSAFWSYDATEYTSVLAHFSWAPRVSIALLIVVGLGLACGVTPQVLGSPLAVTNHPGRGSRRPVRGNGGDAVFSRLAGV